jgi:hypothetical protein
MRQRPARRTVRGGVAPHGSCLGGRGHLKGSWNAPAASGGGPVGEVVEGRPLSRPANFSDILCAANKRSFPPEAPSSSGECGTRRPEGELVHAQANAQQPS